MIVIYARSPYTVVVDEATQIGSKIELRLWHQGETKPTDATYTFSKPNPSTEQITTEYNISPYIKDFITNINPSLDVQVEAEEPNMWVNVELKTFYTEDFITYTDIDTFDYIGVNGFTLSKNGANQTTDDILVYLISDQYKVLTNDGATNFESSQNVPYFNVLVDWEATTGEQLNLIYKDLAGGNTFSFTALDDGNTVGIYALKIPYRCEGSAYINGNTIEAQHTGRLSRYTPIIYQTVCEQKYTPVRCDFINRYGGWQTITFFKARTDSFEFKNSEFKTLPSSWDYNPLQGQTKTFNHTATQSVILNTGYVDENFVEILFDLFASETILIDNEPVTVKGKTLPKKTSIKDKMINYTIDFEYSFNVINDVQ